MGIFSDVLLTVDYDRTLTDENSVIPQRNLDAIRFFMDNGGAFTVNTGRSLPMAKLFMDKVPVNAPLLLYNGGAAYDVKADRFPILHEIALDQEQTLRKVMELCPEQVVEVQAVKAHYSMREDPAWERVYRNIGCEYGFCTPETDMGPFLKFSVAWPFSGDTIKTLYQTTPEAVAYYDRLEEQLNALFGDTLTILRPTPVMLDIQTGHVDKGRSARELAAEMQRKILVCVGDERNDLAMMDAADYAYCPCDGKIAPNYENVCSCNDGAVADVIYKKIPEILGISLDNV